MTLDERLNRAEEAFLDREKALKRMSKLYKTYYKKMDEYSSNTLKLEGDISYLTWCCHDNGELVINNDGFLRTPILDVMSEENRETTNMHNHDFIEIGYIYKGTFKQQIVDKIYEFKQGEFFLIDYNTIHNDYLIGYDNFVVFFRLSSSLFDSVFLNNIDESNLKKFLITTLNGNKNFNQFVKFTLRDNITIINDIVAKLLDELDVKATGWNYIVKGLLIRLLNILIYSYKDQLSTFSKNQFNKLLFQQISQYISENYSTITLNELINKFHYNVDYYNRLIKRNCGLTYTQYVRKIRLEKAKELLVETKLPIEQISLLIGYENKGYFYSIFKKYEGITPKNYRTNRC
ncbi:MAG: AraC family transcriptional regulator [Vallitalea sp.]|jgi:AraC-like DNA-binding protein/mannose-6-phosphate isomerase-like protein (cupin superfamily)|nr:AraC family transcriptional regulator [Vallitalea sp.]